MWSTTFEYFSLLLGSNPDFKRHTQLLWWKQTYLQKSTLLACLTKSLRYIGPLLEDCNHRSVSNTGEDKNHSILYLSSLLWEVKKCPLHFFLKNFFSLSPITSQQEQKQRHKLPEQHGTMDLQERFEWRSELVMKYLWKLPCVADDYLNATLDAILSSSFFSLPLKTLQIKKVLWVKSYFNIITSFLLPFCPCETSHVLSPCSLLSV